MLPSEHAWTFEHSVDCAVPPEFAWTFWTNVSNWVIDADVESIEIDGPFAAGARGFTISKSSGRVEWRIAEVESRRAVIEFPLPGAVGRFVWTFEDIGGRTRITQRCTLDGEQAGTFAKAAGPSLEAGIPAGMQKLCETIENVARADSHAKITSVEAPTRRTELIRNFVLESIANDYENLPQITKDVTGLISLCGLTITASEILEALHHLVAAKLAKAYRLSNTAEEIDGMPPAAEMGSPHVSKLSDAFFWVTEAGKQVLLADYPDWPFDGNMVLRSDWNPPPG